MLGRELQKRILTGFAKIYPRLGEPTDEIEGYPNDVVLANLYYLSEHGLLEIQWQEDLQGNFYRGAVRISARGMDFLQDDGGLSTILGTVTIKLHDDTLRALLVEKIEASAADTSTKARLISAIKDLPAEGLKLLAQKAIHLGLEHLPGATQPLQEWLGLTG